MTIMRPHIIIRDEAPAPSLRTYSGAGGGGTYPRNSYAAHSRKVFSEAQQVQRFFEEAPTREFSRRVYFKVEVPDDIAIHTSKGRIIEEAVHAEFVGSPEKNIGHLSTTHESFGLLLEQLRKYQATPSHVGKSKFAEIEAITEIPWTEKVSSRLKRFMDDPSEQGELLISFFPDLTRREFEGYELAITAFLRERGGKVRSGYYSEIGALLQISSSSPPVRQLAETFLGVSSVDPVDEVMQVSSIFGSEISETVVVRPNRSAASVCIFDSGVIKTSRFLSDSIIAHEEPIGAPYDCDHGTFVASRVIYGESLIEQLSGGVLEPDAKVLSVSVSTVDQIGNHIKPTVKDIIPIIRDTVQRWSSRIKVYNLSMNFQTVGSKMDSSVADDAVSPLAAELDHLARKHDVLFILSTGNFPAPGKPKPTEPYPEYFVSPDTRICPPSEALLAVTVGAVAEKAMSGSMAPLGCPSPFTRRGPGFFGFRKPDLAANGGNYASNWRQMNELSTVGLDKDGIGTAYAVGTSQAAPLISRLAAKVFESIPEANSCLVRALLIHNSQIDERASQTNLEHEQIMTLMGYGCPSLSSLVSSTKSKQSFLFQGMADFRQMLRVPFYVPNALCSRPGAKVRVRATVAYAPETSKTLKTGYCKSHIRASLSKRTENGELKPVESRDSPATMTERYATVVHLDKTFKLKVAGGEWELGLEHLSRWKLSDSSIRFGLVISVSDPQEAPEIDIHASIRSEVPHRYRNELQLRERLRV